MLVYQGTPIHVFSIAVDPLTRMAVDTEKASETDARLENYMLRLLRDRVQESECESLRLQYFSDGETFIGKKQADRMREQWDCERRRLQRENQHLQHLLADRRTHSPSPAPEGFLHQS